MFQSVLVFHLVIGAHSDISSVAFIITFDIIYARSGQPLTVWEICSYFLFRVTILGIKGLLFGEKVIIYA